MVDRISEIDKQAVRLSAKNMYAVIDIGIMTILEKLDGSYGTGYNKVIRLTYDDLIKLKYMANENINKYNKDRKARGEKEVELI